MSTLDFNSEVLVVARESRGLTQKEVSDRIGATQGLISKAERGITELSSENVHAIAQVLGYPVELFFEPGRVREVGSACLYHRKRKTLPAKIRTRTDSRMFMRNINVTKLLEGLEFDAERQFLTLDPDDFNGDASAIAQEVRAAWRLPDGPIPNLTSLVESAGGIVLLENFGHRKLFGMSCWTTRGHPLFYLNSTASTADLRWTLAHEVGHLIMHATPAAGDIEEQADIFAGEFLAPERLFRPNARRLSFDQLPQLKAYWGLSMKGIITRAQSIGAIDRARAVRLYKQFSARGYSTTEPFPLPEELPTLVDKSVRVHLDVHGYSIDELAHSIHLSPSEFRSEFLHELV